MEDEEEMRDEPAERVWTNERDLDPKNTDSELGVYDTKMFCSWKAKFWTPRERD